MEKGTTMWCLAHISFYVNHFCVSQLRSSTLERLVRYWLTLRENKITVKGKGEMQTYWCDPTKSRQSTVSGGDGESTNPSLTNDDNSDHGSDDDMVNFAY